MGSVPTNSIPPLILAEPCHLFWSGKNWLPWQRCWRNLHWLQNEIFRVLLCAGDGRVQRYTSFPRLRDPSIRHGGPSLANRINGPESNSGCLADPRAHSGHLPSIRGTRPDSAVQTHSSQWTRLLVPLYYSFLMLMPDIYLTNCHGTVVGR